MAPQGSVETSYFSEKAQQDLLQLLDNIPGKKNLVLERALVGPIELLVKFSTLKEYGVDRIFFLENDNVDASQKNVVFLACGEKANSAQTIAAQIRRLRRTADTEYDFSLIWTPRRTLVCEKVLEEAGVLGDVTSLEFPLYFQPLEKDVLSLELPDAFSELYLRNDPTCVFLSARALTSLQQRYGIIPRVLGKGDNAHRLAKLLSRMRSELTTSNAKPLPHSTSIDSLIILDRSVDFPSVLLTQLTYEGLIDETFGIRNGQVDLPNAIAGAAPHTGSQGQNSQNTTSGNTDSGPLRRRVQLSSSDSIYSQIRSTNFSHSGTVLSRMARRLQADYEARHTSATTAELRAFVSKLPSYQADQASLKLHTSLAEEILKNTRTEIFSKILEVQQNVVAGTAGLGDSATLREIVEDLIARDTPVATILRLLCLESCTMGGLKARDFDSFRRLVVQAYGYQHILTLDALEKMQLLVLRTGGFSLPGVGLPSSAPATDAPERTNYSAIRRPLSLILDDVEEGDDPSDVAYVFSGYAPLSVRLVQCVLQPTYLRSLATPGANRKAAAPAPSDRGIAGWKPFADALSQIRGRTFDETLPVTDRSARAKEILTKPEERARQEHTTIVFFLGGVTYAEIAALRLVEKGLSESGRKLIVATTGMLGGDGCVGAAVKTAPASA